MAKRGQSDNFPVYVLLVIACVTLCVAMTWMYFDYRQRTASYVAYSSFGPMVVRSSDFSIRATIAVQTRSDDLSWLQKNEKAVTYALQATLAKADPTRLRGADNVAYVQKLLRESANGALGSHGVQDIVLTDFLIQTN